ncbi:MAG: AAA family ATPase [Clostridia bacterium]|nr:AAA family ATPase [Clostridia bacterium]
MQKVLKKIKDYIASKGFKYSNGIIESLFLSLKTKPFVVLCGMSGCGKSSLARAFAESLGANVENGRFKMISVSSDWNSPARFIGNVTPEGKFVPGVATGFIQRAIAEPELPFFLCIDEINLSRPERYMSSFLSALETRRRNEEGRIITDTIFDTDSFGNDISASYSYGGLYIPDNLYVIGTVNMDDVSYGLTTKFVDRVNIIELSTQNVDVEFDFEAMKSGKQSECIDADNELLKSKYINLSECKSDLEHIQYISKKLQQLNEFLKFSDAALSYRTRDDVLLYVHYNREYELLSEDSLFDMIIMQKVLPRISGIDKSTKDALVELFSLCMANSHGYGEQFPNTSYKMHLAIRNSNCRYFRSASKITMMVRRYEDNGITSFWIR